MGDMTHVRGRSFSFRLISITLLSAKLHDDALSTFRR
jgi:hypothetical protein